jgi:acyl-CoA thioester hydrolase
MSAAEPTATFTMPIRVRYVECDMQGRVFNGHYLTWVDMAHTDALEELAGDYQSWATCGVDVVVAAAQLQFRSPARYDDRLTVRTVLHAPGNTSLRSEFTIARADGDGEEVLAECVMTHVCVDATTFTKQPWPDWLRAQLPHS